MKQRIIVLALLAAMGPARAQQLWRVAGRQTLDGAMLIPPAEFSEPRVMELCNRFIADNPGYRILRYFIATDRADAERRLEGPGVTDMDYPVWLRAFQAEPRRPPPTAELLKVVDRAVVRFRYADGTIAERVIGSGSPLAMEFRGEPVKVLDIAPIPPGTVMLAPYPGGAQFFVETPRPWSLALAETSLSPRCGGVLEK